MALLQISEPGQSPAPHEQRLAVGIDLGTTNSLVATVRKELFGGWEGNWVGFNSAHDVTLPNATKIATVERAATNVNFMPIAPD